MDQLIERFENTIIHLRERYGNHARDPGKDNIIIVWKHTTSATDKYHDLSHYVSRIQQRKTKTA